MKLASRLDGIEPFYVMECAKTARDIADSAACDPRQGGEPMIFLNIGEPDFSAPAGVVRAAHACLDSGHTQYTQATGLPELRERISGWYRTRFDLQVEPRRIVVTAGASAALQLACLALFEAGDEVLMPDPCYPCNRHFVSATGARARLLHTDAASRFQLDAASVAANWNAHCRGVLLASPSNPTGTSIPRSTMAEIVAAVRARGGVTLVDEIYLGLSYDDAFSQTALSLGEDVISINSFSKYFAMTGWRLGWMVLPNELVAPVEKLAQNLYICPSTVAQHAALACFDDETIAECERRREVFRARRDLVVPALQAMGLDVPVAPDGAFYAWADCSRFSASSWDFCFDMMRRAHVALTPGRDFGARSAERFLRLSFASSTDQLHQALQRLARELQQLPASGTKS